MTARRSIANLVSIVVVRGREGFEARVWFKDRRDNFIVSHKNRGSLQMLIETRLKGAWR